MIIECAFDASLGVMSASADVEENAIGIIDIELEMARDWGKAAGSLHKRWSHD